ncbi:hypothetical protein BsWGS_22194 [Bradybaena similaris]
MKVAHDMVYFDKSALQKLEAQLAEVQQVYTGGVSHSTVKDALQRLREKARDDSGGYRNIFQSAFKKLEDHVSDVQSGQRNKYRRGNVQRHHRLPSTRHMSDSVLVTPLPGRSQPGPHYSQDDLVSSLQVFQIRKWRPLTANYRPLTSATGGSTHERPRSSPPTKRPAPPQKPRAELLTQPSLRECLWYPPWLSGSAEALKEDPVLDECFSSHSLNYFMTSHRPLTSTLTYRDVSKQTAAKGTMTEESIEGTRVLNGNGSSTSGVGSDGEDSDAGLDNTSRDDIDTDSPPQLDNTSRDDTDSPPQLDKTHDPLADLKLQLAVLNLRPEQLEPTDISEKQEIKCFDFTVGNLENPVYDFKCPVPFPLDLIDLHLHATENSDWRVGCCRSEAADPVVGAMMDRLVQLERLQMETQECEDRRLRLMRKRPVSRGNKARDRRGCTVCLQPGCTGGCSSKRHDGTCCEKCHLSLCNGICRAIKCDLRMRDDRRATPNPAPTPQHCYKPGDKQTETSKLAGRTLLTRPKTAAAVVGRGRSQSECRDPRPISASVSGCLSKEAEKLGLELPRPKPHSQNRLVVSRRTEEHTTSKGYNARADLSTQRRSSSRTKQVKRQPDQI